MRRSPWPAACTFVAAFLGASAAADVRLSCRGIRTIAGDGAPAYRWVEREFHIDYERGEVRDGRGRLLDSAIGPEEVRIEFELDGWPRGRSRTLRIDRDAGAWVETPAGEVDDAEDRVVGTCFRYASGD